MFYAKEYFCFLNYLTVCKKISALHHHNNSPGPEEATDDELDT